MLKTEALSFQYAGSGEWAIKDISLEIQRGECVVLAGPSGCGKSTLIKCFNGLITHFEKGLRAGGAWLDGTDIARISMHDIARRTGAVFQNPRSQFFTTRVTDEIAFGCENFGMPREEIKRRIEKALTRFEITPLRDRKIFDLSNGEQQKVILASVYAMGGDILIMDEPSANLDDAAVKRLGNIIGSFRKEGKTVIIAEHRYHYLKEHADRVVVLDGGRVSSVQAGVCFLKNGDRLPNGREITTREVKKTGGGSLSISNVSYRYPNSHKPILEKIDLSLSSGEIAAITGDNGSGKTTLAMIVAGLIKENDGDILINGSAVTARARTRHCRMVLQEADHQLFTESVYRELEIGIANGKNRTGRIMRVLENVGLASKPNRGPHSLSGGEKQRLAVAAALAAEPEIVILDEPTSGLDAENRIRMGAMLRKASLRGAIVIIITHDRELIGNCCTKVLRLEKGGITNGHITGHGN